MAVEAALRVLIPVLAVNENASAAKGEDARVKADTKIAIDTNLLLLIDVDVDVDLDVLIDVLL